MRREQVFLQMQDLLAKQTRESLHQAIALQQSWLENYPDDYFMLDAGEVLAMSEDTYRVAPPAKEPQEACVA